MIINRQPNEDYLTALARTCDKLWEHAQKSDLSDKDKAIFKRVLDATMYRALNEDTQMGQSGDEKRV